MAIASYVHLFTHTYIHDSDLPVRSSSPSLYVSLCLSLSLSVCLSVSLSLSLCLSLSLSVCVSLCVSLCVCLSLSLSVSLCVSICVTLLHIRTLTHVTRTPCTHTNTHTCTRTLTYVCIMHIQVYMHINMSCLHIYMNECMDAGSVIMTIFSW